MSALRKLWRAVWNAGDYSEKLREVERMRAEAIGMLEACARIRDERERSASELHPKRGVTGNRDPDHPCEEFGPPSAWFGLECDGDGHYPCSECGRFRKDPVP